MKKYWKVIRDNRQSSIVNINGVTLNYPVNEWVYPIIPNSKIMCFNSFEEARIFADVEGVWLKDATLIVVPCKCKKPKIIEGCLIATINSGKAKIEEYWKVASMKLIRGTNKYNVFAAGFSCGCLYNGVVWADAIMCLE